MREETLYRDLYIMVTGSGMGILPMKPVFTGWKPVPRFLQIVALI